MASSIRGKVAVLAACAVMLAPVSPVLAQESDLVGARAPGAETQLQSRGYRLVKSGYPSYWWDSGDRRCIAMYVDQGRVSRLSGASGSDCGQSGNGGDGTAAAVVAGAVAVGLIAALASHRKQGAHHSGDQHDGEYTRGYNDGLYSGHYDQNDSESYHEGYMAGDAERRNRANANSSYVRNGPETAKAACQARGDQYLNVPQGSSVPVHVTDLDGGQYEIVVASGHYRAICRATRSGQVIDINPI